MNFPFELRKVYSFDVYPGTVIGTDFKNVTILGIIDRRTADTITNVTTKHPLVYPYLPSGTSNDPDDYTYLKIRHESGVETVVAYEWIQTSTIEEKRSTVCNVRLNQFSPSQSTLLREVLAANGFTDFEIRFEENN